MAKHQEGVRSLIPPLPGVLRRLRDLGLQKSLDSGSSPGSSTAPLTASDSQRTCAPGPCGAETGGDPGVLWQGGRLAPR